jgi:hypothetical protein
MSATDFLPRREADLRDWSRNFRERILEMGAATGLSSEMIDEYVLRDGQFADLYQLATEPSTRTSPIIAAKNDARDVVKKLARQYAGIIHAHPGVTAEQKVRLHLTVRRGGGRSPRHPRPDHAPIMFIGSMQGASIKLRLRDATSARRGRPVGVRSATLLGFAGETPPASIRDWKLLRMTNRTDINLMLPKWAAEGEKLWITARWENTRCEAGPVAPPMWVKVHRTAPMFGTLRRAA